MRRLSLMRPDIGASELKAVTEVLRSGHLTEGAVTRRFEESVSSYVGARHAVAFTSCTTALETALRVLGVGSKDEVIVPDYTFPATADVVCLLGATPVLVDSEPGSTGMDPDEMESAITSKTKCIMPVSLFGLPLNHRIYSLAKDHSLPVVEDAAGAIGVEVGGRRVGTFADMTCFSFHPRKTITCGEGGMLVTDNGAYSQIASSFKHFGGKSSGDGYSAVFESIGTNYKLSDVLSAIGVAQMHRIEKIIGERMRRARVYNRILAKKGWCAIPSTPANVRNTYQTYTIRLNKDGIAHVVIKKLRDIGIEAQIGTYALHMQPCFSKARLVGALENSTELFRNTIALPLHKDMGPEDQKLVVENLEKLVEDEV